MTENIQETVVDALPCTQCRTRKIAKKIAIGGAILGVAGLLAAIAVSDKKPDTSSTEE
jgi:hypothetical protein